MKKLTIVLTFLMVAYFGVQESLALVATDPLIPAPILTPAVPTLKLNSKGSNVIELQKLLINAGYLNGVADGKYGALTVNAVKAFQGAYSIKKDGIVGPQTLSVLVDMSSSGSTSGGTNTGSNTNNGSGSSSNSNTITKSETISFVSKKNKNQLLKNYACKEEKKDKMILGWGEVIDETTNSIYRMADIWSTTDGVNWAQESKGVATGEKWEPMVANKAGTVYVFGGKYIKDSSSDDDSIYKSTDMVNWTYVGQLPNLSRYYDKSIVNFKNKFWLIASEEGNQGVWSSSNGASWTQELTKTPWNGAGRDSVENNKGRYDSNSLGAFVLGSKMFYLVLNDQTLSSNPQISIYSTTDGKKWVNEGLLKNSKDNSDFRIGLNTNPTPVVHSDGYVYIYSTVRASNTPIVIRSNDGTTWELISNSNTDYTLGYYSSDVSFNGKLWKIGGWNYTKGNDNGIYSSTDGVKWDKVTIKGTNFPDFKDRHLGGVTVLDDTKVKATNLQIARKYNSTGWFTGSYEKARNLGEWNLIANNEKNTKNTGSISISSLSFVGNTYKSSIGNKEISTLESLENVTVYIDDVKVGSIAKFSGPFFETTSSKLALPQTIKFDAPYTINSGQSVWVKLVADFPAPKFGNIEYRTFLNGITFKDGYTTPCLVYNNETTDGYFSVPGANLYYKDGKLPN
jgi:hypothetical protein